MAVSNALATGANNLLNGNGMQRGQVLGEVAGAVIGSRGVSATVSAVSTVVKAPRWPGYVIEVVHREGWAGMLISNIYLKSAVRLKFISRTRDLLKSFY